MNSRGMWSVGVIAVAVGLLGAACADDDPVREAVEDAASGDVSASVCAMEARTVEVAAGAYAAEVGRPPETADELVGEYLDGAPEYHHEIRALADFEFEAVPIPGAGCD